MAHEIVSIPSNRGIPSNPYSKFTRVNKVLHRQIRAPPPKRRPGNFKGLSSPDKTIITSL